MQFSIEILLMVTTPQSLLERLPSKVHNFWHVCQTYMQSLWSCCFEVPHMGSGQSSHLPNPLVVYSAHSPKISNRELTGRLYAEGYLGISGLSPIRCCCCSKGFLTFQIHKDSKMTGETPNFKWWRWLNGGKNQNLEKSQEQKLAPKKSHVEFPSLKNCQKALSDITWMRKILEMESLCLFMEQIS